MRQSEFMIIR